MQRTPNRTHRRVHFQLGCASLLAVIPIAANFAAAQVGPYPAEIPASVEQGQSPSDTPSLSESVRPAMDEILIAQARSLQEKPTQSFESQSTQKTPSTIEQDLNTPTIPLTANANGSKPIGRPAEQTSLLGSSAVETQAPIIDKGWIQTVVALSGVILLILGLGQLYKRLAKSQGGLAGQFGAGGAAPSGIIEVLGRYTISRGMTLVVIKFDRKVLLVSHSTSTKGKAGRGSTMQTLCELDNPEDVASVLLKARDEAGDSIAQSFEQALQDAGDFTDDQLHDIDLGYAEVNPVRFPTPRTSPARTITNDEGDRAELWSSGQDASVAAGVLRKRLSSMRREQQG